MDKKFRQETICIQGGYTPKSGEARVLPIYQSTTFKYDDSDQMGRLFDLEEEGYFYTRLANPTYDAVAKKICELEGGYAAMLTSSGQAANFYAMFNIVNAGDHIVSAAPIYGGTSNLFTVTMKKMGVDVTLVDPDASEEELDKAFRHHILRNLIFHGRCRSPGSFGINKGKSTVILHFLYHIHRLQKIFLCLAGESDDDICRQGNLRDFSLNLPCQCQVLFFIIFAVHQLQNPAAAGLQGQMEVTAYFFRFLHHLNQFV